MQNDWWMRPALQKSEAVLLPALPRRLAGTRILNHYSHSPSVTGTFLPANDEWAVQKPVMELSTYVRPRGSMAGRSVLRAAGVRSDRFMSSPVKRR